MNIDIHTIHDSALNSAVMEFGYSSVPDLRRRMNRAIEAYLKRVDELKRNRMSE